MGVARRATLAPAEARKRRAAESSECIDRRSRGPQLTWQQGFARTARQGFKKKQTQALKPHVLLNTMFRDARLAANQLGALGCLATAAGAPRNLRRCHGKPSLYTTGGCPRARVVPAWAASGDQARILRAGGGACSTGRQHCLSASSLPSSVRMPWASGFVLFVIPYNFSKA